MDLDRLRKRLSAEEGRKPWVYLDSATPPHPTVGVGFNLDRGDAPRLLASVGADFHRVRGGVDPLTEEQIDALLDYDIGAAIRDAHKLVHDFDALPEGVQQVLADLVFNMGFHGVSEFKHMLAAIDSEEWSVAAMELRNSKWFSQVASRGPLLVRMLAEAGEV